MKVRFSQVSGGCLAKFQWFLVFLLALFLPGCTTVMVQDPVKPVPPKSAYCVGSEWSNDSTASTVPVPIFAFFFPHYNMYEIKPEEYLRLCGPSDQLVNREVIVSRDACIPASLTWLFTFGAWKWCPAYVEWEADIVPNES